MAERSLALARAGAQRRLLAGLAATVFVLVFASSFALGWLTDAVRTAVADAVAAAAPADRQTVLSIPVAGDPVEQAAGADALLRGRFGDSLHVEPESAGEGGTSRWTLTVDPRRFDPWRIAWIAADLHDLGVLATQAGDLAPEGASAEGGLADALDAAVGEVLAVGAVVPVPLALIAIAGIVAVVQLASLLGRARSAETAILRARGRDGRAAARGARIEGLAIVLVGALPGWLVSVAAVALVGGAPTAALRSTWVVPALAVLTLGLLIASAQLRAAGEDAADRGGRRRTAVTGLVAVLVVLAAGVFVWQLLGLEGDATALTGNAWSLVVLALTPALGLAAIATVVLVLFGPAASALARAGARGRGVSPAMPTRMIARHVAAFGVIVALLSLAAGGAAFGGTMTATWQRTGDETAVLAAGADVRATVASGAVPASAVAATVRSAGVTAAAAVADAGSAGGAELQVVALPEASVPDLLAAVPSAGVDPRRLGAAIAGKTALGEPLGADAAGIRMTFAVAAGGGSRPTLPAAGMLGGEAWFLDDLGTPVQVPLALELAPDESTHTVVDVLPDECPGCFVEESWSAGTLTATATLPSPGDWALVGYTIGFPNSPGSQAPTLTPLAVATIGGAPLDRPSTDPFTIDASAPIRTVTAVAAPDAVPVVVTRELADALDLTVGGEFELTFDRSRRALPVEIADIVRVVPGTTAAGAALVPLDQATLVLLASTGGAVAPTELWASGPDAAAAVHAALPSAAVVEAAQPNAFRDALVIPWWIAVAATALLAGIAVVAAALGLAQQRGTDVFVLRGLGLTARRQSVSRSAELSAVAAAALVSGAVLGGLLAFLCGPVLTRTAVAGVPAVISGDVVVGILPIVVAFVVAGVAVTVACAAVGRLIARQARAGRVREAS